MAVVRRASPKLCAFLIECELDEFAEDIVTATGLWHLQDLNDTVFVEDDLSELRYKR